jgi:hypothetical protein
MEGLGVRERPDAQGFEERGSKAVKTETKPTRREVLAAAVSGATMAALPLTAESAWANRKPLPAELTTRAETSAGEFAGRKGKRDLEALAALFLEKTSDFSDRQEAWGEERAVCERILADPGRKSYLVEFSAFSIWWMLADALIDEGLASWEIQFPEKEDEAR